MRALAAGCLVGVALVFTGCGTSKDAGKVAKQTIEDDWDGFGQRLTGTGTTRLSDVYVADEEYFDLGEPDGDQPPTYNGAFLQLYLQAVTAGVLRSVRNDAVALAKRRARNFSHAAKSQLPSDDRQVLQVGPGERDPFRIVPSLPAGAMGADRAEPEANTRSKRRPRSGRDLAEADAETGMEEGVTVTRIPEVRRSRKR